MTEMTVEKAVEWLTSDKAFGQECYSRKQIAALIEQQAAEIAKLKAQLDCGVQEMAEADKEVERLKSQIEFWTTSHEAICKNRNYLGQEIAKKDRMIKKSIDKLFILPGRDECPDDVLCPVTLPNTPDIGDCRKCWRKWLEKEAEVQG